MLLARGDAKLGNSIIPGVNTAVWFPVLIYSLRFECTRSAWINGWEGTECMWWSAVASRSEQDGSCNYQSIVSLIAMNLVSAQLLYTTTCTNGYTTMMGSIWLLSCASGRTVWLLGKDQQPDIPNVAVLLVEASD